MSLESYYRRELLHERDRNERLRQAIKVALEYKGLAWNIALLLEGILEDEDDHEP